MFTIEEVWEEQERQYNQLMEEDDQYCHPESFRWGFEHGVDYALTKAGWHPASELLVIPEGEDSVWVYCLVYKEGTDEDALIPMHVKFTKLLMLGWVLDEDIIVKWWCYPPQND
jgi:hypothetical protein